MLRHTGGGYISPNWTQRDLAARPVRICTGFRPHEGVPQLAAEGVAEPTHRTALPMANTVVVRRHGKHRSGAVMSTNTRHAADPAFGPALRTARHRHGWSLADLAHRTHLSRGYLSLLENSRRAPSVVTARLLADVLDLLPDEHVVFQRSGIIGVGRDWSPPVGTGSEP
jgi:DNA-binding XRE family transcriptional regulator